MLTFVYYAAIALFIGIASSVCYFIYLNMVVSKNIEHTNFLIEMILDGDLKSINPINNQMFHFQTDDKSCRVVILRDFCAFTDDLSKSNNTYVILNSDKFHLNLSRKEISMFSDACKKIGHNKLDEKFMEYKLEKARELISSLDSRRST